MQANDDASSVQPFGDLLSNFPDLTMPIVADVLDSCNYDYEKAYSILCEMVIPPDSAAPKPASPSASSHYASSPDSSGDYPAPILTPAKSPLNGKAAQAEKHPSAAATPAPQGAWARKPMARRYRVDAMCARYEWIARSVVEDLFEKYQDCVELVETEILHMFPIDQPEAYGGGQTHPVHESTSRDFTPQYAATRAVRGTTRDSRSSPHRQAIAESLRKQDADQMRRDALSSETISQSSKRMDNLRRQLWETREDRMRLQQLANQTRKPTHIALAKDKDAQLRHLSALFLERMRRSEEYRNGVIDLHGLTKEEAIQLIDWKLQDAGRRRFRVITGKGIHSQNGQAVLRPALEKYFRSKGISFSMYGDAVISVTP